MFNTTGWNRRRYSLYAPVYDAVAERAFRRARRTALDQVLWRPGVRVLLVGAGTGLDLPFLPRDVELHGTDLSPAMVRRLERRAETLSLDVQAEEMDAENLEYPDDHFDVVVMHLCLLYTSPSPRD